MRRKLIKWLPNSEHVKKHKHLSLFGKLLEQDYLWQLNRYNIARAASIGVFCGFLPIPFQMLLAALFAIGFRANLIISVVLVWFSNPVTMPAIFYFCYRVGLWIMHRPTEVFQFHLSWTWLTMQAGNIAMPLLLGCIACAISFSILSYWLTRLIWYYWIVFQWKTRH